jgi:hypothetical protein
VNRRKNQITNQITKTNKTIKNKTKQTKNKMNYNFQQAIKLATDVDPVKFFNGETVNIDMVFNDRTITTLFSGSPNGTVTIKGKFPRASSISAKLPVKEYGCKVCYEEACKQILPQGIMMVLKDYPVAKEKHKKDLKEAELIN